MLEDSMVLLNASVMTLDSRHTKAQAVAIEGNRITAVGSDREIRRQIKRNTKVIDCKKATVIPGLVDSHVHMREFGFSLHSLDLRDAKSIKEIQRKMREHVKAHPKVEWILGGRWDQEKFKEKRYPTRLDLDAAVVNKPVLLSRVCGHFAVANSKAIQIAHVNKKTRVKGGVVDLDSETGEPNGILRENAIDLVSRVIPRPNRAQLKEACLLASQNAVAAGLTTVHWLVSSTEISILHELYREGKLPIRTYLGIPIGLLDDVVDLGLCSGFGNDFIKIGFVKILSDGSLGARTAAMKEPYTDSPQKRGMMLYSQKDLEKLVMKAHEDGFQLGVHAIGDRAVENVLIAYEKALNKKPRKNHRHRIEHSSIMSPKLIEKMRKMELVASVQPHFIISDFWTLKRIGPERARWAYSFKTMLKKGIVLASGSDCPVEKISPLLGIWAAVTRKDNKAERLTLEEAIGTYTKNAAYASFDEKKKGTIEPGRLADITVLSKDLKKVPPDKIRDVTVEMTIVDGKIVYERKTK